MFIDIQSLMYSHYFLLRNLNILLILTPIPAMLGSRIIVSFNIFPTPLSILFHFKILNFLFVFNVLKNFFNKFNNILRGFTNICNFDKDQFVLRYFATD